MNHFRAFQFRQVFKQILQLMILPCAYGFWRMAYFRRPVDRIVLADAHHDAMPYSMENICRELTRRGYTVTTDICNYKNMSILGSCLRALRFMRLYAQARYVFICDNFLPVVSCRKNSNTTVIQLWHSCGLLKKMGYDTQEDVPKGYRGHMYRNYDLVTVSAPCCVGPLSGGMRLNPGIVKPLGVSRTDNYFSRQWREDCAREFYRKYPGWKGKKLILWAPTFRGNAGNPTQVGVEAVDRLEKVLGPDYVVIRKVHPYVDARYHLSNCDIPTERLFPVIDLLISDYSSVVCEFMAFQKPYVLFAPDLRDYSRTRGFYVPYESLSPYIAENEESLHRCVLEAVNDPADWVEPLREFHLQACDGNATGRILDYVGLKEVYANV